MAEATAEATDADQTKPPANEPNRDVVTTGVAKGRDRLDSAVSTSVFRQDDIQKLAPRSVAELLRDIPGIRSEAAAGESNGNLSIRGLPIASNGAKYVQIQEDGLPILEFGDIGFGSADSFLRTDLSLAQVDVIRGGSASTFASNSPGGIINFISKTGDVEGGAVQTSAGLDYDAYRLDVDYGARISDTLRFHVGGFYRQGEGPRRAGYDAVKGGQIKLNVTKDFAGGYIRFYGKYLDDRSPAYDTVPMKVSGTDADPSFSNIVGFRANNDSLLSRYITTNVTLDENNNIVRHDIRDGQHAQVKSFGIETQFEIQGWNITERFRYSDIAGTYRTLGLASFEAAEQVAQAIGGAGATLRYASGPDAQQPIADPAGLNGNGLLARQTLVDAKSGFDNATNDLRGSRVWSVGGGDLTTTLGFYASRQTIDNDFLWTSVVTDVRGDGRSALVDILDRSGRSVTQDGFYSFNFAAGFGSVRRSYRVNYTVNAPFASANYHIGRLAIGGSLRYDYGNASGSLFGSDLGGGRVGTTVRDMNGDGVISPAETMVGVLPLTSPAPVDYGYRYLSYSTGINFRIAEPLAVFARYSRGGRVNADRILFSSLVSTTDGRLTAAGAGVDMVNQAEAGVKYRRNDLTLNLTGFWAKAQDTNLDVNTSAPILREYKAKGLEFEGGYRRGLFSLTAGATYTDAEISKDTINPVLVGNVPRHQAKLIFQATPQISTDRFSLGAVFIGTTDSFAQDTNQLKMPGYVTTNAFVQFRPIDRVLLSLNANNLFDTIALTAINQSRIPASGIVNVLPLTGRTISASARFEF